MHRLLVATLSAVTLVACGPASSTNDGGTGGGGGSSMGVTSIAFKAKVGTQDFACGQTYTLGNPQTQYQPRDFRLYVHDVKLVAHDGSTAPFALTDDGVWQRAGIALLDFENKAGECANGTTETNVTLRGGAPANDYHQLKFTLGVPFSANHQDATAALPPLNTTAMFWSWMGGYKFLRADGVTTGLPMGHNLHLGSTACVAGSTPNSVERCDNPNRLEVTLDFDPTVDAVVVDLAAVLGDVAIDTNLANSAPGCMSAPTDVDCAPIFANLGLGFGGTAGNPANQKLFKKE